VPYKSSLKFKLLVLWRKAILQFRNLDASDPSQWPVIPRALVFICVALMVVVGLWFLWVNASSAGLGLEKEREVKLREEFASKLGKSKNLESLKKQREQVQKYVTELEKQLPGKAEMDALLSDINQAGIGRNLQFELFRPGQIAVKDYYAELPIAVRVTGSYQNMGAFAADIARLSRIVTLNNLLVVPLKDGSLAMDATAKTFRYLDDAEVVAQKKVLALKGEKK
jgi:type IV pilus assembly protein PilO